ncbi:MAG: hypothetical protein JO353_04980 [Phycisphaerae bacterium]|nr:hypothetical protein [Phycisphaerae bacterium]
MPKAASTAKANARGQETGNVRIVLAYLVLAFAAQLILLLPGSQLFRMPLRIGPFMASLALVFFPRRRIPGLRLTSAVVPAVFVLVIVAFGFLNGGTESLISAIATLAFYAAILSPLVWVGRLQISERGFVGIILALWIFNTMSCAVGVLQVMYPGRFIPTTSLLVQQAQEEGRAPQKIDLASGQSIERPYGLTDQPGGVASNGTFAFMFGLGLLSTSRKLWLTALYAAGMAAGIFIIYICEVRVALVVSAIMAVAYLSLLFIRGQFARGTRVLVALAMVGLGSTISAMVIGGSEIRDRAMTLFESDFGTVYYGNRGAFLENAFYYALPQWPMGAGLGRYGMIATYFTTGGAFSANALWAEIQWQAWVYDGGWLMVLTYPIAILLALWMTLRVAIDRRAGDMSTWATIMASYNVAAIAITFSYSFFLSQSGLEFWLLNALLYSAYQFERHLSKVHVPAGFEAAPASWKPVARSRAFSGKTPDRPQAVRRPLSGLLPQVQPIIEADDGISD